MRAARIAIPPLERMEAAASAASLFLTDLLFKRSQHIAAYLGQDEEFDAMPIIQGIWRAGKSCYIPVISSKTNALEFAKFEQDDPLHLNRYQILEPEKKELIPPEQLDLVLMPLVAFDSQGHRLGMGGGYYDRTFEFLLKNSAATKPVMMGLAFSCQEVASWPVDPWDIPLGGVLTEKKLMLFNRKMKQ